MNQMPYGTQAGRRRTFAIISHPDAGKTTLTEKFLLYGGAVNLAGSVTARKNQRSATSDWMELERQRGISVSSTVLQFEYGGYFINLLDTPGHKDFSEDTYRVLTAVDAVVMVIDAGKGIEDQTRKLFEVCRRRGIPIFTFVNKLDRPTLPPLGLLDEIEEVLGIDAWAANWPLGTGPDFRGLYDRRLGEVHLYDRSPGGTQRAALRVTDLDDPVLCDLLGNAVHETVREELEMLDAAGATFDEEAVLAGRVTPVFFGSAVNNFGVEDLLNGFLRDAPGPTARPTTGTDGADSAIAPGAETFSGFVFKIQANMDPRHRDRIAFVRVCSGRFEREMTVAHPRSGRRMRLSSSHKLFANERQTVDEAFAGDVIGIVGHNDLRIGDTLTTDPRIAFPPIPPFAPECFAFLHPTNPSQFKRFREGLDQLLQEGVVQSLTLRNSPQRVPLLAAVGPLQFDVVQARLEGEYGASSRLEMAPWSLMRWVGSGHTPESLASLALPSDVRLASDATGQAVLLFGSDWYAGYFARNNPTIPLLETPAAAVVAVTADVG